MMNYIWMYTYQTELYHHGVKGQKWGVRRYQNYDGTYTKKGLERYNKAASDYTDAKATVAKLKEAHKQGTATKAEYKTAKVEAKNAKRTHSDAYKQLKNDYNADKGKELYKQGKTISDNRRKSIAVGIGSAVAKSLVTDAIMKHGNDRVKSAEVARAARVGISAASIALSAKYMIENKQLRAYYAH